MGADRRCGVDDWVIVVPVNEMGRFRSKKQLWLIAAGALILSGCWGWIPESPAPGGQAQPAAPPPAGSQTQAAPASSSKPDSAEEWYTVKAGDTLFSIAWRVRVQLSDLAAWNNLGDGSLILVGQRLRLTPPLGTAATSPATGAGGWEQVESVASPGGGGAKPAAAGQSSSSAPGSSAAGGSAPSRPSAVKSNWQWPAQGRVDAKSSRVKAGDFGVRILGQRGQDIVAADSGKIMYAGDGLKAYGLLVIVQHTPQWLSAYGHNEKILVGEGDEVRVGQAIATMGVGPGNAAMLHFEIRRNGKPVEPIGLLPPRN